MRAVLFMLLCAWAAALPFLRSKKNPGLDANSAAAWPSTFEGRPLQPLPLTALETRFAGGFPGDMARFTDGRREILFRRVASATRRLHPSAECLEATGHVVKPLPAWTDGRGRTWSRLEATKDGVPFTVRESICEDAGVACWSDVPAWYWPAVLGRSVGPWTAVTVSGRED